MPFRGSGLRSLPTLGKRSGSDATAGRGELPVLHAWPRVLPTGPGVNRSAGLDFYKRLVDGSARAAHRCRRHVVSLGPAPGLQDRGGWENRDCAGWFSEYAAVLFDALDGVHTWLTINQPKSIIQQGYQLGWMAPGRQDNVAAGRVIHHLGLAHGFAVQAFRASGRASGIGPVPVLSPPTQLMPTPPTRRTFATSGRTPCISTRSFGAAIRRRSSNSIRRWSADWSGRRTGDLKTSSAPVDLVGLNYYSPIVVDRPGQSQIRFPRRPTAGSRCTPTAFTSFWFDCGSSTPRRW